MVNNFNYYDEDDDFSEELNPPGEAYQEYLENPNDLTAMEAALEVYGIPDPRLIMDD
ncbi:MAG: hypothetical protein KME08_00590 [Aphanothece sp. CMT-3BRIN-NPC111]|jgi:hypothetical protein|nr:hypothetical protein [Aphanothece sp. CMT-3BRIN-NPC111]